MDALSRSRQPACFERAWLERYLARKLGPPDVERFEIHALDKPGIIEQVEFDNLLRRGLVENSSAFGVEASAAVARTDAVSNGVADNVVSLHRRGFAYNSHWLGMVGRSDC